jgi:hypothetical protein
MAPISFRLSYDYRCPFAKIMHLHVLAALEAGTDYDVEFVPWSLNQPHRHEGDPDVWNDPRRDGDLVALAASVSVRDQQPEQFALAHRALFRARHDEGVSLKSEVEVLAVLERENVDVGRVREDLASRRPHAVIGATHGELAVFEPFGVPTFFIGDAGVFVRYMENPTDDARVSIDLVDHIVTTITQKPLLNEFKHTRLHN